MSTTTRIQRIAHKDRLLVVNEAAEILGVTPYWVRQLINDGSIRAINVGGFGTATRWRIDPEDLAAWMQLRESRARDLAA